MRWSVGLVMLFAFSVVALPVRAFAQNQAQSRAQSRAWTGEVADLVCTVAATDGAAPADAADTNDAADANEANEINDAITAVRVTWRAQDPPAPGRTVLYQVGERSTGTWRVVRTDLLGSDVTLYLTVTDAYSVRVRGYVAGADPTGEWTAGSCTAADATSEPFDGLNLARLGTLLIEPLVVFPSSEMVWAGTIVNLATYEGPHVQIAKAGLQGGHTIGLLTGDGGLFCLAPYDGEAREAYTRLEGRAGERAEVVGLLSEDSGMPMITVTSTRPGS